MIREKKVRIVVNRAYDHVTGGYENAISDGHITEMPPNDQLKVEIYEEVMHTRYIEFTGGLMPVKKDIRFFTKAAIMNLIEEKLNA